MSASTDADASGEPGGGLRYRFADAEFDESDGRLRVAGHAVELEPRPLRLLLELLRHAGEVVTKEELFETVWEGRPTVDHVLANAISKLRSAFGARRARGHTCPDGAAGRLPAAGAGAARRWSRAGCAA